MWRGCDRTSHSTRRDCSFAYSYIIVFESKEHPGRVNSYVIHIESDVRYDMVERVKCREVKTERIDERHTFAVHNARTRCCWLRNNMSSAVIQTI